MFSDWCFLDKRKIYPVLKLVLKAPIAIFALQREELKDIEGT